MSKDILGTLSPDEFGESFSPTFQPSQPPKADALQALGVTLAIAGNMLISLSLNLQKAVHNRLKARGAKEGEYLKEKGWWIGMLLMLFGEIGNFMAYGMAPASVVSPLGAVSVVSNAVIATKMLGEPFRVNTLIGVVMTISGGVLFVTFAPEPPPDKARMNTKDLELLMIDPFFLFFIACVLAVVGLVYYFSKVKDGLYSSKYVFVYLLLCSTLGSITVLCIKAESQLLQLTLGGEQQFLGKGYLPYALVIITALTGFLQIRYLQLAMETFGNSEVVPVYYVLFTLCTVLAGAVGFKEFQPENIGLYQIFLFFCGMCCTFVGVFCITAKRAQQIFETTLPWKHKFQAVFGRVVESPLVKKYSADAPSWATDWMKPDGATADSEAPALPPQTALNVDVFSPATLAQKEVDLAKQSTNEQAVMAGTGSASAVMMKEFFSPAAGTAPLLAVRKGLRSNPGSEVTSPIVSPRESVAEKEKASPAAAADQV